MSAARLVLAALVLVPAVLLTWLFDVRYWAHRDCIAEAMSSCLVFDEAGRQVDNLTSGGMAWGVLALPFWLVASWLLLAPLLRGRR